MKEKTPELQKQEAEENQSFFSKYWLYIVIGFLVLPNLLSGGGEPEAAATGNAPAKKWSINACISLNEYSY